MTETTLNRGDDVVAEVTTFGADVAAFFGLPERL